MYAKRSRAWSTTWSGRDGRGGDHGFPGDWGSREASVSRSSEPNEARLDGAPLELEFAGRVERRRGRSKFDWTTGRDGKRQYYADASCRQTECHIVLMYGQLKLLPLSSMSLMSVSIGVFPTSRTKNSCSITCEDTVLRDGSRSSSLPNLVG